MFRIVKSSTLRKQEEYITTLTSEKSKEVQKAFEVATALNESTEVLEQLTQEHKALADAYDELKAELDEIKKANERENSVTIHFDDEFIKASPIVKYKPEVVQALEEQDVIPFGQRDKYAVELAIITLASDALNQLVDAFSEPFAEVTSND